MNRTTIEHAIIALLLQLPFSLFGFWWAGAAFAIALFIGREHAQAEYRWIDTYGAGRRANMPWWGGFDPRVWGHIDSWLDWLAPSAAVSLLAWRMT